MRVGIMGLSEGNGHPFSFSAIVNGYDRAGFERADWPVILAYLDAKPPEAFGFEGVSVTHAWTQDPALTRKLCDASRIPNAVAEPQHMLGKVDALIVARDDWQSHAPLALPFLERGVPVFIDKPLSLDGEELARLRPYLEQGLLMSTSGMRYAGECDELRARLPAIGPVRLVTATVLFGIDRYGIHMLDAIDGLGFAPPVEILRLPSDMELFALRLADGTAMQLNCLGSVAKTFRLGIYGTGGHAHVDLHDNFTAFRRTLGHFFKMVETRVPPIDPRRTLATMRLIMAARNLAPGRSTELLP